ncbi:hypothetical protein IFJ82_13635 [Novacetimonas hansenii]|uniref:LPS-assembly lipoprotein n=3 Tax=Novacetimonas hansenii TaxID=436 RepID=A0ABQ0SD43_NOVHA|nr:LPS assembly lipoprotein LptE [Novacetimonas hansenii]EFG85360.1 hypothetical protein GXY_03523 [Novacetimonas hansenii ATCC 23769]PYD72493.1 hypothetical protein CFR74_09190 [Novacetimonas hansenii]QOF94878.1 hypothetical protein IFJ82_13635 [Novacetimonas hansenii]GAN84722.1 hypothetical protein Gaha_0202_012 [Novacetimonas hansenii JCM 7643]GEC63123.1 hypothetical protein GHA01_09720 [Novacetimonas hansenii]
MIRLSCRRSVSPLFAAAFVVMMGGCGFSPMYQTTGKHIGPDGKATVTDVAAELQQVYVPRITERYGQQLRQFLQQDLGGAGPENPTRYSLRIRTYMMNEAVDIHSDNTSGRTRTTAFAHWQLYTVSASPRLLAEGDANIIDGVNNTYEQYFALSLNLETVRTRVAKNMAEQITQQVGVWFRTHAKPATDGSDAEQNQPRFIDPDSIANASSNNQMPSQRPGADGLPALATGRSNSQLNDESDVGTSVSVGSDSPDNVNIGGSGTNQ